MAGCSQSNLIAGQDGRKMLGAVCQKPDAMTLLPTGSEYSEYVTTQHMIKRQGILTDRQNFCLRGLHCLLCKASPMAHGIWLLCLPTDLSH